jgi:hypothetical protein
MSSINVFYIHQALDHFKIFSSLLQNHNIHWLRNSHKQSEQVRTKVHRYFENGHEKAFMLESVGEFSWKYVMTAFGSDIKIGDFIVVNNQGSSSTYKVEHIDYYLEPADMWMASLMKCNFSA